MDSRIHVHLAGARLQDSLRDAATARAVPRLSHGRPYTRLAMPWQRKRRALAAPRPSSGAVTHLDWRANG